MFKPGGCDSDLAQSQMDHNWNRGLGDPGGGFVYIPAPAPVPVICHSRCPGEFDPGWISGGGGFVYCHSRCGNGDFSAEDWHEGQNTDFENACHGWLGWDGCVWGTAKGAGGWVNEHRWQLIALTAFVACEAASTGAGTAACLAASTKILFIGTQSDVVVRELTAPDGPQLSRFVSNSAFNLLTTAPALGRGGFSEVYSGACAFVKICADPFADDPWDPNDDPGWWT